eukprot:10673-Heterococcus_DN1.PRE.3
MSSKADKLAAKALVDQINTAVASKDASALQTAYAQLIKLSAIEEGLAGGETQGYDKRAVKCGQYSAHPTHSND